MWLFFFLTFLFSVQVRRKRLGSFRWKGPVYCNLFIICSLYSCSCSWSRAGLGDENEAQRPNELVTEPVCSPRLHLCLLSAGVEQWSPVLLFIKQSWLQSCLQEHEAELSHGIPQTCRTALYLSKTNPPVHPRTHSGVRNPVFKHWDTRSRGTMAFHLNSYV